jgi:mannosyltransferase OCH1-like enzyme
MPPRGAPRKIHQIWMQGFDAAPAYVRSNARTIQEMHTGWEYTFWDEARIERLADANPEWRDKYASFTLLHQRVDFAKLLILYAFGGIVIDADAYTIRPLDTLFDELADADLVVSDLRLVPLPFGWVQNLILCGVDRCLNNGSYIGKAGSHALAYMIRRIVELPSCAPSSNARCIDQTTGPDVFNKIVREYMRGAEHGTVVVLESDVMEPCLGSSCDITDRTYVVHKHEMTWFGPVARALTSAYYACPHLVHALFCVAIFALVAGVSRLVRKKPYRLA